MTFSHQNLLRLMTSGAEITQKAQIEQEPIKTNEILYLVCVGQISTNTAHMSRILYYLSFMDAHQL